MSVVVWDGITLACDSDTNDGQVKLPLNKIFRVGMSLCGVVGLVSDCMKLKQWAEKHCPPAEAPDVSPTSSLLRIDHAGMVSMYSSGWVQRTGKLAIGSGRDFAYGAMFMGADAEEAVRAAIKYSATCSGEVLKLRLLKGEDNA